MVILTAAADIPFDLSAVCGFSPAPDGSLRAYAGFDRTDPVLVNGENGRPARIACHESIGDMYIVPDDMVAEGQGYGAGEIARAVSTNCDEIRLSSRCLPATPSNAIPQSQRAC